MKDYSLFRTEDFVLDEKFCKWINNPDAEKELFWSAFLHQYPNKKKDIEVARLIVLSLQIKETEVTDHRLQLSLQQLEAKMEGAKTIPLRHTNKPERSNWQLFYKAAAVVALIIVASLSWLTYKNTLTVEYRTAYGEIRKIVLPDQSIVTLNANTRLVVPKYWNSRNAREVWLNGEAFFSVEKKPGAANAKFIVHTSDLAVEVLGTSFNVKERNDGTKVVLSTGKVQLNLADTQDAADSQDEKEKEDILMQPGELVEFQKKENKLLKKVVNPENYTSWRNNKLILDNTSLAEIARIMQETYGVKVYFEDSQLQHVVLNGTSLPTDNQTALLNALSTALNVAITKKQDKIIFRK